MKILKGGSFATIRLDESSQLVYKFAQLSNLSAFSQLKDQYVWMKFHNKYTPQIISDGFESGNYFYAMKFVDGESLNTCITEKNIEKLISVVDLIKSEQHFINPAKSFEIYINRLKSHISNLRQYTQFNLMMSNDYFLVDGIKIKNIDFIKYFELLQKNIPYFNDNSSVCHGDFTLENIFLKNDEILLIDSNYILGGWNSFLLDLSKLYQSLHFFYEESFNNENFSMVQDKETVINIGVSSATKINAYNFLKSKLNDIHSYLLLLEISHYIRMLIYKLKISDNDFYTAYVRMCQVYQELECEL